MITIALRHENQVLDDVQGLEKIASVIIENMKKDHINFFAKIKSYVRPMNQLEAGLHLNISDCRADTDSLMKIFGSNTDSTKHKVSRIRFIARNFVKLDFICENCLPFRVNSDDHQDSKIIFAFRSVMTC